MPSVLVRRHYLPVVLAVILFAVLASSRGGYAQNLKEPPKGDMSGNWRLAFTTPEGAEDAMLDLQMASDGSLSGSITSQRGTAAITSGYLTADDFSFTINVRIEGVSTDVVFAGKFDRAALQGSFDVMGYSVDFTGTKSMSQPVAAR